MSHDSGRHSRCARATSPARLNLDGRLDEGQKAMKFSFSCGDFLIVDTRNPEAHQSSFIEFPVLIPIGAIPLTGGIVAFIRKTDRYPVAGKSPNFFDQAIVEFAHSLLL